MDVCLTSQYTFRSHPLKQAINGLVVPQPLLLGYSLIQIIAALLGRIFQLPGRVSHFGTCVSFSGVSHI